VFSNIVYFWLFAVVVDASWCAIWNMLILCFIVILHDLYASGGRFSGDAILVLYEPDRGFMSEDAPSASRSRRGDPAGSYEDLPAMRNAAYRAVSEGLKVRGKLMREERIITSKRRNCLCMP